MSEIADKLDALADEHRDSLRAVAAWSRRHPDVDVAGPYGSGRMLAYTSDPDEFTRWALALADGAPVGAVQKSADEDFRNVTRSFGWCSVQVYIDSGQCERVQVGTTTETVIDPEAPKITREVPVYEYRCPPLLGASEEGEVTR